MDTQMEIDRKELKYRARQAMSLTRPSFWVVTLAYLLLTEGVSTLIDVILTSQGIGLTNGAAVQLFFTILLALYSTVLNFGYNLWSLWTCRKLNPGLNALARGFSVVGSVLWMEVGIVLRAMLMTFPLACAAILVAVLLLESSSALIILSLAVGVAAWVILLSFALSPYLLADHPEDGADAAIRRSRELMQGWKWELFKLELSFLGWNILQSALPLLVTLPFLWHSGFFDLMITASSQSLYEQYTAITGQFLPAVLSALVSLPLSLWLTPYQSVSRAEFYEARLQAQQAGAAPLSM
jgi:uncharacterized membrane protein